MNDREQVLEQYFDTQSEYDRVLKTISKGRDIALLVHDYYLMDQLIHADKYLEVLARRAASLKEKLNEIH